VRDEILGVKTIVHNYGHDGGGVILSWGTAVLALEEAPPVPDWAEFGCGAVGLATTFCAFPNAPCSTAPASGRATCSAISSSFP
jgi:hypothetical protein